VFDNGEFKDYFDKVKNWARAEILNNIDIALDTGDKAWYYNLQNQLQHIY
jgi:uncharacterized protein YpiB (UPF0302 family)